MSYVWYIIIITIIIRAAARKIFVEMRAGLRDMGIIIIHLQGDFISEWNSRPRMLLRSTCIRMYDDFGFISARELCQENGSNSTCARALFSTDAQWDI